MTEQLQDIVKTITLNAPIEKVWETVATAEKIATWFMPNDFQPIEGHEFTIQSPFGPSPCKVERVDAPHFLRFAWDEDGWFVTFELKEVGQQTEFTLTHGGWKEASHIIPKANTAAEAIRTKNGWRVDNDYSSKIKRDCRILMSQSAVKYDVFQAIADPTRRNVLQLLAATDRPISNISEHFDISRTAVVKHLKILEQAELISAQKKGREKIYTLHSERLKEIEDWLQYFHLFWDNKLAQLQSLVEDS